MAARLEGMRERTALRWECKAAAASLSAQIESAKEDGKREKVKSKTLSSSFAAARKRLKTHYANNLPMGRRLFVCENRIKVLRQLSRQSFRDAVIREVLKSFSSVLHIQFKYQDTRYQSTNI